MLYANATGNVLILRNEMNLYPDRDRFQVSQERLLSLVADVLFDVKFFFASLS